MIGNAIVEFFGYICPLASFMFLPALFTFSYHLDKKQNYGESDEDKLYEMSKFERCSEFDIFCTAAEKWHIPIMRVEDDFGFYLANCTIPFYVRDYIRSKPFYSTKQNKK